MGYYKLQTYVDDDETTVEEYILAGDSEQGWRIRWDVIKVSPKSAYVGITSVEAINEPKWTASVKNNVISSFEYNDKVVSLKTHPHYEESVKLFDFLRLTLPSD